ncbi:hypothetical protein BP6252_05568 [Coleophoma cylindrospora]|uniref:YjgF-like protein n=1 Tax=Coleophoma cylindrospora TaxID=1849047 RepID=A0A3D8RU34_9HELO|nr:hypothetical protein BP6252_05568 [Coleophoma cylindrospora]
MRVATLSVSSKVASAQENIWPKKEGAPPRAGVPYSPATKAGGFIFISGQTSVKEDGDYLSVESSVTEKAHRMCQNARAILESAGSSTEKVVNVKVYFTNIDQDYDEFNKVYAEYFPHNPSRTSVEVTGLPKPADLEIDVIALA